MPRPSGPRFVLSGRRAGPRHPARCPLLWLWLWAVVVPVAGAAASPVRSAGEDAYPPFCSVDAAGRADGFSVELLRAALTAMGREVTFRTGAWAQVKNWLEKGEVEALPLVGRTPEREAVFDFTFPYLTMHGAIVVREETRDIHSLEDLRGRTVAVMQADNVEEFLRREDRGMVIRATPTFEAALRELAAGRHDAVVVQKLVGLRLLQELQLQNLRVVDPPIAGFSQDFCFAVREGDRETLALLNEGLALIIADGTYRRLHAKWFAALELPADRRLVVGGDSNYPPYEFLDENGRPSGYNTDLTRALARELGLEVDVRLGPWAEMVRALERGEIDALQGMFYSVMRERRFDFTQAHTVNHCVAVTRAGDGSPPETAADLRGRRIVVQDGDILHAYALENGLAAGLTVVPAQEEALRQVAEGRQDCALVARMTALYWIERRGWRNLTVGQTPLLSPEYCYAAPNGHRALLAEIGEGLKVLEESGEYRRIHGKWMKVYEPPARFGFLTPRVLAVAAASLLFLVVIMSLWSWSLRRLVASRTAELQDRQRQLANLMSNLPGMAYRCGNDPARPMVFVSEGSRALTGFAPEELTALDGVRYGDLIDSRDRERVWEAVQEGVLRGEAFVLEYRLRDREGSERWVWERGRGAGEDGAGRGMSEGFVVDVTEHKKAEDALREREAKLNVIYSAAPVGIGMEVNRTILEVNDTLCRLTRYAREELTGRDSRFLYLSEDEYDRVGREKLSQIAAAGSAFVQTRLRRKDGGVLDVLVGSTPLDPADLSRGVIFTALDISEQRRAERARRESEEKFRAMVDNVGIGVALIGPNLEILELNRKMREWFPNIDPDRRPLCYRAFNDPPRDGPCGYCPTCRTLEDGMVHEATSETPRAGGVRNYRILSSPLRDAHGQVTAAIEMVEDITERLSLEDQLRQAQKMESVGRLAGGVAHDFNNLLTSIMGFAELSLERLPAGHPIRPLLEEIIRAARRSAAITRQLLAFARKQTIVPRVLDLNEAVAGMLGMLRHLVGEDIELAWRPGARLWPVRMDPSQLDQILANLFVNARDAIAGAGRVTVETANVTLDEAACAETAGLAPGDWVVLAVSDDGCGMNKETLEHIFEPFFTTKGVGKGTGLGLATVYGIVRQNEGLITVHSEPGKGAAFRIYLPRVADEAAEAMAPEAAPAAGGKATGTILVVEDEPSVRWTMRTFLEGVGYDVLEAARPQDALRLAAEHGGRIDLLITDVVLPEMNGRELAEELGRRRPGLKCLFVSGYTADVIAPHGVLEPGVSFIAKPFSWAELGRKVCEVIGKP